MLKVAKNVQNTTRRWIQAALNSGAFNATAWLRLEVMCDGSLETATSSTAAPSNNLKPFTRNKFGHPYPNQSSGREQRRT